MSDVLYALGGHAYRRDADGKPLGHGHWETRRAL